MNEKSFEYRPAGLLKRLMAIIYDGFLLLAILFMAQIIPFAITGDAITRENSPLVLYLLNQVYLLVVSYLFFGWFWVHGGQTLGMKTWRIQLKTSTGGSINWQIAAIRFLGAIISWSFFALGFVWSLVDKKNRCWHDIMSATVLIQLDKNK